MFKVIKGGFLSPYEKNQKLNKIYEKCFYSQLKQPTNIKKIIFYGIKYLKSIEIKEMSLDELNRALNLFFMVENLLGKMSFYVILEIFPIIKDYNGKKWECKDYFSTMEYLEDKDLSKMISEYDLDDFFWNYYNNDIMNFSIKKLLIFDRIRLLSGKESLMRSFIREFGEDITTYSKINDTTLLSSNGDIVKISKKKTKIPKYLKVVK